MKDLLAHWQHHHHSPILLSTESGVAVKFRRPECTFGATRNELPVTQPLAWCLLGRKAGDNAQVRALAAELNYPTLDKHIAAQPWELLVHLGSGASLAGIDVAGSSDLTPPWPDLVITAGRRNEPVAHWIRRQSAGHARLVHIGRPWAPLDSFDLIVTTPQYALPQQHNILHNELPLHRLLPTDLQQAAREFAPMWQELPRPWIAALVGGDSGRFVFTPAKAGRLGRQCEALAREHAGSLLITNSPRTPEGATDVLLEQISAPYYCYRFEEGGRNPYQGLLALADMFVVTGESMSMLAEASSTHRPLLIFDMGDGDANWWRLRHNYRYKPLSHRFAMRFGPRRMRRDVARIQQSLIDSGRAAWLGEPPPAPAPVEGTTELATTAARVRQLLSGD
jgi:mitochondrial fission protein ELM1